MNSPEPTAIQFFGGSDSLENAPADQIGPVPDAVNELDVNGSRVSATIVDEFAEEMRL